LFFLADQLGKVFILIDPTCMKADFEKRAGAGVASHNNKLFLTQQFPPAWSLGLSPLHHRRTVFHRPITRRKSKSTKKKSTNSAD